MASPVPFFITSLPQLPTNVEPKIENDLRDVYNAIRNLAYQIGQYGGFETVEDSRKVYTEAEYTAGPYKRRVYCKATEALTYGAPVNLFDSGGELKAQFANATNNTRPCYGICNTPGTAAVGDTVEIALPGCYVTSIGGMTRGQRYFLSTVNGAIQSVAPAAVGNVRQALGFALDVDVFFFFPNIDWTVI